MAKAGAKRRPAKLQISNSASATSTDSDGFRIDVDIEEAERAAARVRAWLVALRGRHRDLTRFEYTRHVRIVPASTTHSHPILTLGTRFAESEDHLLTTYLHEQMHWYLWRLGGPDWGARPNLRHRRKLPDDAERAGPTISAYCPQPLEQPLRRHVPGPGPGRPCGDDLAEGLMVPLAA